SSGMATGGRVLYHLREALPDPRNTVMFVGYQAAGTRGRRLLDGEPTVRLKGMDVPVHARIARLDSMSAHADANEIMRWLGHFTRPPQATYLVHGEGDALQCLKSRIATEKQWHVAVAGHQQQVEL
ncbi:MAG: MBL fold metallo-hydrolase RNA specificity domain-containing protein, partial [Vicinamibacterales bacterium]